MRGFRKTGWDNESFAVWQRRCHTYQKKYWKIMSPYSRRCRSCARALAMMERKNERSFIIESARFNTFPREEKVAVIKS